MSAPSLPGQVQMVYDSNICPREHEHKFTKPISFIFANLKENGVNIATLEYICAWQVAQTDTFEYEFVNKNGNTVVLYFEFDACAADLSSQAKSSNNEGSNSSHSCTKCCKCLHKSKLKTEFTNSFTHQEASVKKRYGTLQYKLENKAQLAAQRICSPSKGLWTMSKEQMETVEELVEQEIDAGSEPFKNAEVGFYGPLPIARSKIERWSSQLGGKVVKISPNKEYTPQFVFTTASSFVKYNSLYIPEQDQSFLSLRGFLALALSSTTLFPFESVLDFPLKKFAFTEENTTQEAQKAREPVCNCEIDCRHDGRKGQPHFLEAYAFFSPLFAGTRSTELVQRMQERYFQRLDVLHVFKGMLLDHTNVLLGTTPAKKSEKKRGRRKKEEVPTVEEVGYIDKKSVLSNINTFVHRQFHQFTGSEHRELLFGAQTLLLPHFHSFVPQMTRESICKTFTCLQELCALAYTKQEKLQACPLVRQRVWVLRFQLPKLLLRSYGISTCVNKLWSNYLHDIFHLPEEFERGLPVRVSMERGEQELAKLNKLNTNNNALDAGKNWLNNSEDSEVRKPHKKRDRLSSPSSTQPTFGRSLRLTTRATSLRLSLFSAFSIDTDTKKELTGRPI